MARRRVGVVVLLDPPVGAWIDGLRRAVGDGAVERIGPHITLVPPLNPRPELLEAALERLRAAAASVPGPLELVIGPLATFLPVNPVLYLTVAGDIPGLRRLRDAAFAQPLTRDLSWDWVPHVTVADELPPARIVALTGALDRFAAVTAADRVTLLEERHGPAGRRWEPLADAALGPPPVVGRGGLEVTLVRGNVADPVAAVLLGEPAPAARRPEDLLVVTAVVADDDGARRGVGAAALWRTDDGVRLRVGVEPGWRRRGIGSHLLAASESAAREGGWLPQRITGEGAPAFYRRRSATVVPASDDPTDREHDR